MLRPWSAKRVPWSKPGRVHRHQAGAASSSDGEGERRVEAGEDRPRRAARATGRSKTALTSVAPERDLVARRAAARAALPGRAAGAAAGSLGARGRGAVDGRARQRHRVDRPRRADRRGRLAELRRRDVVLARVACRRAGSRTRGARSAPRRRAEAGVLDDHRERDAAARRAGANAMYSAWSRWRSSTCEALYFSFGLDRRSPARCRSCRPTVYGAPTNDARRRCLPGSRRRARCG